MSDIDGMEYVIRTAPLDGVFTRRQYMTRKLLMTTRTVSLWQAIEAVASTALAHREWDMDEQKTWDEWETALQANREEAS